MKIIKSGITFAFSPNITTIRFRTVVGIVFSTVMLVFGCALLWFDHHFTVILIKQQLDQQFDILAHGVTARVAVQFDSADSVLDTLTVNAPPLEDGERTGMVLAHTLTELRRTSPAVKSLITASADGRYVLAEHVVREGPSEPTALRLRIGRPDDDHFIQTTIRLTDSFEVVSRSERTTHSYDPRNRPWYKAAAATEQATTTPRYLFSSDDRYGFTMSRRTLARPVQVFGIDIRLDSLSSSLQHMLTFEGERIAVLDAQGRLLGASGSNATDTAASSSDALGLTDDTLKNFGFKLDRLAFEEYRREPRKHDVPLYVDGGPEYVRITPFIVNNATMIITSSVPASLFQASAKRFLLWSLTIQAGLVVAATVLAITMSRFISQPISALASDVETIAAFEFPERPRVKTRILELQRLSVAVDLLELTLRTLSTYLPQHFVRDLMERRNAPALGGIHAHIAVLFTDIEDFTAMAEIMEPTLLMTQLSKYFKCIIDEVLRSGGTLDKLTGDGVMAFWILPEEEPERAVDICRAVLRAVARVDAFNNNAPDENCPPFKTRFGIHAGQAMVGSVGTTERMNFTAFGHVVNVASRIEQLNKIYRTKVLVTAAFREAAGDGVRFRHVDAAIVRGVQSYVEVFELLSVDSDEISSVN